MVMMLLIAVPILRHLEKALHSTEKSHLQAPQRRQEGDGFFFPVR